MAENNPIYVYPPNCDNFNNTGLVGDLRPLDGSTFTEEKNGMSEVVIRLPYDQFQKWKAVQKDCIIKAKVPKRVPPVIQDDEYVTAVSVGTP